MGTTIWSSGGSLGNAVGTHLSTAYYSPGEEWANVKSSAAGMANGLYQAGSYVYNNPGQAAASAFNRSVSYLDQLTTDPTVSGEFVGKGLENVAIFAATAGAGNFIKGTQAFQSVAAKIDNAFDAVKRLEVYPTNRISMNPTGFGIRQTATGAPKATMTPNQQALKELVDHTTLGWQKTFDYGSS